ncbi:uncharacterized protein [Rutidosis leptorrhynchoides]|uniref:uncharacterized protein isoform X2 n=1 Tax=Rutidosis leptorrhynchoides TaxID=125765 RepID=UPI003A98D260
MISMMWKLTARCLEMQGSERLQQRIVHNSGEICTDVDLPACLQPEIGDQQKEEKLIVPDTGHSRKRIEVYTRVTKLPLI